MNLSFVATNVIIFARLVKERTTHVHNVNINSKRKIIRKICKFSYKKMKCFNKKLLALVRSFNILENAWSTISKYKA